MLGPDALVLRLPANRSTELFLFAPNLRTGYVQHYSLMLQREIFRNTVVEAGYVGSHGVKLFMNVNLNQPPRKALRPPVPISPACGDAKRATPILALPPRT